MQLGLENLIYTFDFINIKKYREKLCLNYIKENYLLSPMIIKYWKLERVKNKYINKSRDYAENSYSKRKIKEEELIFLSKIILFFNYRFYIEEQKKYADELLELTGVKISKSKDLQIYKYITLHREEKRKTKLLVFTKNEEMRLDMFGEAISLAKVREKIIKTNLSENNIFSKKVIENYKLGRIVDKYIDKTRDFEENYYAKQKVKEEEIIFIVKFFLFGLWNNRVQEFNALEKTVFSLMKSFQTDEELRKNNQFFENISTRYFEDFYNNNITY